MSFVMRQRSREPRKAAAGLRVQSLSAGIGGRLVARLLCLVRWPRFSTYTADLSRCREEGIFVLAFVYANFDQLLERNAGIEALGTSQRQRAIPSDDWLVAVGDRVVRFETSLCDQSRRVTE
jgi:hypothetical protein